MDGFPITSEDPDVRQQFAENIFQILRPLSALEIPPRANRREDEESSECSALSDPFSDLDESYILLDQRKKKPGVDETDELLLMNQFTPEFRNAYDELMGANRLRKPEEVVQLEPASSDSCAGCPDMQTATDFSPKFRSFIDEMLRKCDLQHHQEEKKRREQQQLLQQRKKGRVRTIVSEESFCGLETDSMSGMWRMLDAMSENERELLPTSGPHYDLYYDRRFDWMTRDEIPWDQVETSKKKCEQWLKIPCQSEVPEGTRPVKQNL
ncbi:uncharacterized protein LOC126568433 [Anopheles maculipalpis]|uniref:uncharacterized protein LOC126568433 n=1 Tax=Anopheles maculipalpis TaxID=1496333 RepID=UPI0021595AEB|nr:uncharacterized protein LOC126568433 [Anopheles maculipalpis]